MTDIQSASPATTQDSAPRCSARSCGRRFGRRPPCPVGWTSWPTTSSATGPAIPSRCSGVQAYTGKIAELLAAAPDLRLELVDSATVPGTAEGEQLVFLHYVGRGTGPQGPFEIRGLDRVRTRNGMVVENVIRYEPVFVTRR